MKWKKKRRNMSPEAELLLIGGPFDGRFVLDLKARKGDEVVIVADDVEYVHHCETSLVATYIGDQPFHAGPELGQGRLKPG